MTSNRDAPAYFVQIATPGAAGHPVDVTERVLSLTFDDQESKADKLELDIDNSDLELFDDPHWKHGNTLIVSWGYVGNMTKPRRMVLGKITGARTLKIEALAESILMNKDQKSRCFEHMSTRQIMAKIAKSYGIDVADRIKLEADKLVDHLGVQVQQANMTDSQFLAFLANRDGLVFNVKADGMHFDRRDMSRAPTRKFVFYKDGTGDVLDFNVENDVTMAPGRVVAKGRDMLEKKDIHEGASNTETKREGHAPITHTVDRRTLTTATAPIAQNVVVVTSATNAVVAKQRVDGKYIKAQQSTVKLSLSVIGDPSVLATSVIEIHGISKRLSGKYYVVGAKHKLNATSYVLELECRTDGAHGSPAASGVSSAASLNTKPPEDPKALKPTTVFVDGRTLTTYRK